MKVLKGPCFLTLVCVFAMAIVHSDHAVAAPYLEEPSEKPKEEDLVAAPKDEVLENISISKVPPSKAMPTSESFDKKNYYYPFRKEIDLHIGSVMGIVDSSDDDDTFNALLGFSFVLPKLLSPKYEVGADLSTVGHGHLWVNRRKIYNEKSARRPYYEYGLMHKFVPDEKFASFSNWENYLLRIGAGIALTMRPGHSYRIELEAAAGIDDILVMFTGGYVWGF